MRWAISFGCSSLAPSTTRWRHSSPAKRWQQIERSRPVRCGDGLNDRCVDLRERIPVAQRVAEEREDHHDERCSTLSTQTGHSHERALGGDPARVVRSVLGAVSTLAQTVLPPGTEPLRGESIQRRVTQDAHVAQGPLLRPLLPVASAPQFRGAFLLAVVQAVADDHQVGVVGHPLRGELLRFFDGVHPRPGKAHDLPGFTPLPGEDPSESLGPRVLVLHLDAPREGVAQDHGAPRTPRLRDAMLDVAVAERVRGPRTPPRVDRSVRGGAPAAWP